VNVTSKRTWNAARKNALAVLRQSQVIHGGDLILTAPTVLVHLLTFSGNDNGCCSAIART
jgi:hypothetical protein